MKTLVLKENYESIATNLIKNGEIIVVPTETVYGLAGDALNKNSAKKIYSLKGRPQDNPLIVHISEINEIYRLVCDITTEQLNFLEHFWPGPLTVILKKSNIVPIETTGGLETVAIRMPNNNIIREIIKCTNTPLAAPSANLSGKPSPTRVEHVLEDFDNKIPLVIDGGQCELGIESTIIDLTSSVPRILRPGVITLEEIKKYLPNVEYGGFCEEDNLPIAPGMKYKHYAPEGKAYLVCGDNKSEYILNEIKSKIDKKIAVISFSENISKYENQTVLLFDMGSKLKPIEVSRKIFHLLRKCDEYNVEYIYIEFENESGIFVAIKNRLIKATSHNLINT